ncbi:HAMP domain-containing sensor histidine kinase [Oscillibacter sp.]|jgi:signal transduction histidine kinase|uniref:sensor histidine kinase n=1 Tax=Oscillibacter sp. TaxID=1945593 RepID=UPI00217258BF|nr:HAMP domain-containing sensor histidine kinase [Oscillibacter sp.]MCI9241433.1 HAMP domain-containing histidine kinase [Oscillibacter sp.]
MKAFGKYISKYLLSFFAFALVLLLVNILAFALTFGGIVSREYGAASPANMLEAVAADLSASGISEERSQELNRNQIWAMLLDASGRCIWEASLPEEIPTQYTIQDVAVFSKGYLQDYPVFVRNMDNGLLVLGYPKDSFMKLTGNYFPIRAIRVFPLFVTGILAIDILLLFLVYYFSKRRISKNTEPIMASIKALSAGKPVDLSVQGELSEIADSVNQASQVLSRQNQARANWISGVSHDIRTPLSMIMGYAQRIAGDHGASGNIQQEAEIIRAQSAKIKDLVQDLNLVSQLEYEMQPLHKEPVRLSKLLRSYAADLLNAGIGGKHSVEVEISSEAETAVIDCDARLISRAIGNLVQNSINHNPQGCNISLSLDCISENVSITVADNGVGLSAEKLRELEEKPHYMESTDERLDLRHGLGLLLVMQIVKAHGGTMEIESAPQNGYKTVLTFQKAIS